MKQISRKTGGFFLLLGLVMLLTAVCGPGVGKCYAADAGSIDITAQPQANVDQTYGGDYTTLLVTASATNGSELHYQWYMVYSDSGITTSAGNGREQLRLAGLMPGNYQLYCTISAAGCDTVTSSRSAVTVRKAVHSGLEEATVYVQAEQEVSGYSCSLPQLPSGEMEYQIDSIINTDGLIGTNVQIHPGGFTAATVSFDINAAAAGSRAEIKLRSTGGIVNEDAVFTLTVVVPAKTVVEITGITADNRDYSGSPCTGYTGTPSSGTYGGSLAYHYYGIGATSYDSTAAPVMPGTYRLAISVPEDNAQYAGLTYCDFAIYKVAIAIRPGDVTVRQGQPFPEPVISYRGFLGTDTEDTCFADKPKAAYGVSDSSSLGSSYIYFAFTGTLTNAASKIYTVAAYMGTLTVTPKSSACDITGINLNGARIGTSADPTRIQAWEGATVSSRTIVLNVSEAATWEMYSAAGCLDTDKIEDETIAYRQGEDNTVYLKVTAEDGTIKLYTLVVTVAALNSDISIEEQPEDVTFSYDSTGYEGNSNRLSVRATGDSLTYQWYIQTEGAGTPVAGATGALFYVPSNQVPGSYYYFCKVSNGSATVETARARATITKAANPWTAAVQASDAPSNYEKSYTYTLPGLPAGMSYDAMNSSGSGELLWGYDPWNLGDGQLRWDIESKPAGASLTIVIPITGNEYYEDGTFTLTQTAVAPTPVTITGITAENVVYEGLMNWAGYTGTPSAGAYTGELSYFYTGARSDGLAYSSSYGPWEPGSYTLTVSVPAGEMYAGFVSLDFTVAKRVLTVKADDLTIRQGNALPAATVSYSGLAEYEETEYLIQTDAVAALTVGSSETAGTFPINITADAVLTPSGMLHYTLTHVPGTLTITAAGITYYTVSFNTGAGSAVAGQSIVSGEKASRPADPAYAGYTFGGWYADSAYTMVFDFTNTAITADTTVYAKWTQNDPVVTRYTVSFSTGAGSAVAGQSIVSGEKATRPVDPTYAGYTFGGWYADSAYTTEFDFTNTAITADTTVYVKWSYNGGTPSGSGSTPADTGSTDSEGDNGKDGAVYEIEANNAAAWSEAAKAIQSGNVSRLTVELRGTTVIPAQILQAAAGKDITITVKLGENLAWNIQGSSLTDSTGLQDIDMKAELISGIIPQETLDDISGQIGEEVLQLHLSHEGSFGFGANLKVYIGIDRTGRMANLFYYNPDTKELEFVYAAKIDSEGYAEFPFNHASDYAIAVDEKQLLLAELNKIQLTSSKKTLYIGGDMDTQVQLTLSIPDSLRGLSKEDGLYPTVTYNSSNPEVATVSADGKVTALKKGKVTITAVIKAGDATQTLRLTLTVKKAYIKLVKTKNSLKKGESFIYTAVGYGVSTDKITFTTTEKSVVVIDKKSGKAVAKTTGADYVVARYGKLQVKQKVTVK